MMKLCEASHDDYSWLHNLFVMSLLEFNLWRITRAALKVEDDEMNVERLAIIRNESHSTAHRGKFLCH